MENKERKDANNKKKKNRIVEEVNRSIEKCRINRKNIERDKFRAIKYENEEKEEEVVVEVESRKRMNRARKRSVHIT